MKHLVGTTEIHVKVKGTVCVVFRGKVRSTGPPEIDCIKRIKVLSKYIIG